MRRLIGTGLICNAFCATGQLHVDPPWWWGDVEGGRVEVLISGEVLGTVQDVQLEDASAKLEAWRPAALPGHVWVTLDVGRVTEEHEVAIRVKPAQGRWRTARFVAKPRREANRYDRWEEGPAMYLIMPDRFANGNPDNDDVPGMRERGTNRDEMYARHGGDLDGITAHLPYLQSLGVGALWLTPVVENDLAKTSYHGYACTDAYRVDPRLGTLDSYKTMVREAHKLGIRVVHDWVPNHWGNLHRLLTHPVDSGWVHNWSGGYTDQKRTNYRSTTVLDPYAIPSDLRGFNDGWFDRMMPDMDQSHPDLQRYMGTNIVWWMAEVGIDGLRIDTYTYGDQDAMAAMTRRVANAFPESFMFAEAWVYGAAKQAALVEGSGFEWSEVTGLDGAVDFAWHFAMQEAVHEGEGWERGIGKVYEVLAEDFLYPNPRAMVTFLDNHDTHRWLAEAGDEAKAKAGLAMLLLGRGTPCLYYGTELGFATRCEPDGKVRQDMPGGWPEDTRNAFSAEGRTASENAWYGWIHGLLDVRNSASDALSGTLEHTFPKEGLYAFARRGDSQTVIVTVNAADRPRNLRSEVGEPWIAGADRVHRLLPNGQWLELPAQAVYESLAPWECGVWWVRDRP